MPRLSILVFAMFCGCHLLNKDGAAREGDRPGECADKEDNDGDGRIDCADADCAADLSCDRTPAKPKPPPKPKRVTFDFSERRPKLPTTKAKKRDVLARAVTKPAPIESIDCAAGTPAQLVSSVKGRFTSARRKEILHLVRWRKCDDPLGRQRGRFVLQGTDGGMKVFDDNRASEIEYVRDLDGDGQHEILVSTDTMAQGVVFKKAALLGFTKGKLKLVQDFGVVIEDESGLRMPSDKAPDTKLSVLFLGGNGKRSGKAKTYRCKARDSGGYANCSFERDGSVAPR